MSPKSPILTKTVTTTDKHVFELRVKRAKKRLTSAVEEQKSGLRFNHGMCKVETEWTLKILSAQTWSEK